MEQEKKKWIIRSSNLGEKNQDTTATDILSMPTPYVDIVELKARIKELESIHLKIKFQIIRFQQENDKLWKEKKRKEKKKSLRNKSSC